MVALRETPHTKKLDGGRTPGAQQACTLGVHEVQLRLTVDTSNQIAHDDEGKHALQSLLVFGCFHVDENDVDQSCPWSFRTTTDSIVHVVHVSTNLHLIPH